MNLFVGIEFTKWSFYLSKARLKTLFFILNLFITLEFFMERICIKVSNTLIQIVIYNSCLYRKECISIKNKCVGVGHLYCSEIFRNGNFLPVEVYEYYCYSINKINNNLWDFQWELWVCRMSANQRYLKP